MSMLAERFVCKGLQRASSRFRFFCRARPRRCARIGGGTATVSKTCRTRTSRVSPSTTCASASSRRWSEPQLHVSPPFPPAPGGGATVTSARETRFVCSWGREEGVQGEVWDGLRRLQVEEIKRVFCKNNRGVDADVLERALVMPAHRTRRGIRPRERGASAARSIL